MLQKASVCPNNSRYDWDEFQKIEGCATAEHTNIKDTGATDFWKSQTVSNAKTGLEKVEQAPVQAQEIQTPKSIDQFNKELDEKKKQGGASEVQIDKKPFVTPLGKNKCTNKGCNKEFDSESNDETSCNHHPGNPVSSS